MNYYESNIKVLKQARPWLAKIIQDKLHGKLEAVLAKSGDYTLKSKGKEIYLLSSYDPVREAEQWVKRNPVSYKNVVIILGYGLAYHIKALLDSGNVPKKIIVIEPHPESFMLTMSTQDLSWLLGDSRVILHFGTAKEPIMELFRSTIKAYELENIKCLTFSPVVRHFSEEFTIIQKHINDAIANLMININTLSNFAADWTSNFLLNLPYTLESPGVSCLKGVFENKPAIIISAGPSLNKNVHLLKDAKNHALLIAVGPTLKILLDQGIEPDIVVTMDAGINNWRHFEHVLTDRPYLIFDFVVNYNIVHNYRGPKFVCGSHVELIELMKSIAGQSKGSYKAGPSVANMAFDLARQMKANPIILVGQDLAYTGGLSHAKGTVFSRELDLNTGKFLVEVEDIYGNKVITDRSMYTFLEWFEREIIQTEGTTVIDATEGGARIKGTTVMPLKQVLDQYCRESYDFHKHLHELHQRWKTPAEVFQKYYQFISLLAEHLDDIYYASNKGIERSHELAELYRNSIPQYNRLNKVLKKLDQVDKVIKEKKDSLRILELIFRPVYIQIQKELNKENRNESDREQAVRIARNSKILYTGIRDVAEHIGKVVKETRDKFLTEFSAMLLEMPNKGG